MVKVIISIVALCLIMVFGFILNNYIWMPESMQKDTYKIRLENIKQTDILNKLKGLNNEK